MCACVHVCMRARVHILSPSLLSYPMPLPPYLPMSPQEIFQQLVSRNFATLRNDLVEPLQRLLLASPAATPTESLSSTTRMDPLSQSRDPPPSTARDGDQLSFSSKRPVAATGELSFSKRAAGAAGSGGGGSGGGVPSLTLRGL